MSRRREVDDLCGLEPTVAELRAIQAQEPLLAAELAVVEAQCRFAARPDRVTRRALRRAEAALGRALAGHANTVLTSAAGEGATASPVRPRALHARSST